MYMRNIVFFFYNAKVFSTKMLAKAALCAGFVGKSCYLLLCPELLQTVF